MQTTNPDPKTMTDAELSAWLAEHLMGWSEWVNYSQGDYDGPFPMFARFPEGLHFYLKHGNSEGIWSPPTNIQQAMEDVVGATNGKHRSWALISNDGYDSGPLWTARLRAGGGRLLGESENDDLARAICEAAYLALVSQDG